MRITTPGQARANFYDRNSTTQNGLASSVNAGPHAATTRATYTVPASRKAIIHLLHIRQHRLTVATTPVSSQIEVDLGANVPIAQLFRVTNIVGDTDQADLSPQSLANAAELWKITTANLDTGGTLNYTWGMHITEFDA